MSVEIQRLNVDLRGNPGLVSELLAAGAEFYTLADKAAQKGYSVTVEDLRTTQDCSEVFQLIGEFVIQVEVVPGLHGALLQRDDAMMPRHRRRPYSLFLRRNFFSYDLALHADAKISTSADGPVDTALVLEA